MRASHYKSTTMWAARQIRILIRQGDWDRTPGPRQAIFLGPPGIWNPSTTCVVITISSLDSGSTTHGDSTRITKAISSCI